MQGLIGASVQLLIATLIFSVPRLAVGSSQTRDSSPYQAQFKLERVYELARKRTLNSSRGEVESVPRVRLEGRIRGVGFVDARFKIRRNRTWDASLRRMGREFVDQIDPVLLQGKIASGGAWRSSGARMFPVAASIIGDELKVSFPGRAKGSRKTWQRVYTIRMKLDGAIVVRARVSSIPKSAVKKDGCGAAVDSAPLSESVVPFLNQTQGNAEMALAEAGEQQQEAIPPIATAEGDAPTSLTRVVTISTDADPEWYQKYGEQSNAVIASLINAAEAIYNRQLGLRFRIVKQHVYTDSSPYTTTDAGMLLSAFTRNVENAANLGMEPSTFHGDVDLKHLFSGKDLDGSIIGIAYIGVVCAVPSLSYGITQSYLEGANAGIFAHELGHNFGAAHDSSTREGLMFPSISVPSAQKFSDASLGEISSHLSKYGSCISLEQMVPRSGEEPGSVPNFPEQPSLSSAKLSLKRTRVGERNDPIIKLSGSLLSQWGTAIPTVGVRLLVGGENIGQAVTAADGSFEFFVRLMLPRGRRVYVYVETEGGEVFSNFLWLGRTTDPQRSGGRGNNR
jgi:hypothetical protein